MKRILRSCIAGLFIGCASVPSFAEDLSITTYGSGPQGYAYAVAKGKRYFEEFGVDVSGFLGSSGGGTTIRNLIGGRLAYGEASLTAVILAIREGADIKIISGTNHSPVSLFFGSRKGSDVRSVSDLKGKRIAYTVPRSGSHIMALALLEAVGLKEADVELVKTGGLGEGLVALDKGLVDVAPFYEPAWTMNKSKYQLVVSASDVLPALTGEVGITTGAAAKARADFIRGVIKARAKAIDFMQQNPKEASEIIARDHKMDPAQVLESLTLLFETGQRAGYPYFSRGEIDYAGMDKVLDFQRRMGAFTGDVNWSQVVDESFLTDEMKSKSAQMKPGSGSARQ